ncbi:MAG TPA: hypothetical protein RMH99_23790 [Sandaracinaceae bacterium LLY-WYZ-13_1]|nr:hypothetical protein [Sandaracinaceae bacterium LLY-WYZ-13_1]
MRAFVLTLASLAAGCGAAAAGEGARPELAAWTYTFTVDPSLTRLEATVCFEGPPPSALTPIDAAGARYLRGAEGPLGPEAAPLSVEGRAIATAHLPPDACVAYVVDLDAAARQRGGLHGAYRIDGDLIAATGVWLWAPRERAEDARVTARFELPDDVRLSPLWARAGGGRHRLDERAFRFTAYAAFGRFETVNVGVPGACLHVSVLGGGVRMGTDGLVRSLRGSADAVSMMFGEFPVRRASILAVPTPFSTTSPFGIVGRGTLPTVAILVGDRAEEARLARAWVPVHELAHLAMPFVDREDAWLAEGIATYYQEILRARAGLFPPEQAWRNLDDGFRRGARDGTGRSLREESRDMMRTAAYRRVYWAGAAIALLADVEMRARSNGRRSLDDALERLRDCCADRTAPMSGREALERLDAEMPGVIAPIARRWLGADEFPDLRAAYARLGLTRSEDGLGIDPSLETRTLREAIVAPRVDLAPIPRCGPHRADRSEASTESTPPNP